jgi:murein DD-endopeptidase MepM/ murein hydrolase activator NlpD
MIMAEQEEKKELEQQDLSRKRIFTLSLVMLGLILALMVITAITIAYTPLREYIPGYSTQTPLERKVYALSQRADSIERELARKDVYFNNLKLVIEGYPFENDSLEQLDIYAPLLGFSLDTVNTKPSSIDSAFRAEFEEENLYNLNEASDWVKAPLYNGAAIFFSPLVGSITKLYNPSEGHFGVDIVSTENQVIKATLDGTVVFASWTLDYGYVIGIQHEGNYFSCYKHNATLLKKEGDFVKAGEAIAILGASGELSEGPRLHFELWRNGISLNPTDYINFETDN